GLAAMLLMAGCGKDEDAGLAGAGLAVAPAQGQQEQASGADAAQAAPPALEDVMERDPRYLVGISFPAAARNYPRLATALHADAQAARADLDEAVASLGEGRPSAPYDLALDFAMLVENRRVVAVRAEGSSYTGGAHGNPLVARFVWLPRRERMLEARDLIADEEGWR